MTYWPDHSLFGNQNDSTADDLKPSMRGINSIQLFDDGTRWWILSVYWQHETPEYLI